MDFCKAIKTLKIQKGLSNRDISKQTKTSMTTVSNWCTGVSIPSIKVISGLCVDNGILFSKFVMWGE